MSVFDLKRGESAEIVAVDIDGAAAERLRSLGVVKGQKVTVVAFSLFRGSVLILCAANRIALRRSLAERVGVKKC